MAVKKYFADADTTITNAFKTNLTTRGIDANMGASDILETFSIYGQASSDSTELERLLIKFPIDEITAARAKDEVPASGSVKFYLKMYNAPNSQTIPRHMTLNIFAVSRSWQEGIGLDMSDYQDTVYPGNIGATWMSASSTEAWTLMGGDYHTSPAYSAYFDRGYEDLDIDVTELVEQWIAGTKENYGFGIHLTASQEAYFPMFDKRESVNYDTYAYLSGALGTMTQTEPFTVGVWVSPADSITSRYIGFWTATGLGTGVRYFYRNSSGKLLYTNVYTGNNMNAYTLPGAIPQDVWTHVAVSHDPSDLAALPTLYINGISSSITVPTGAPTGVPQLAAGFSVGGWGDHLRDWSGSIDDVAYYDSVLSAADILEIYNKGCPTDLKSLDSVSSLQHWWINGDDPNDAIRLGTPPTEVSIYDQVGSLNLYATGTGGMAIDSATCAEQAPGGDRSTGELINYVGAQTSYYTKIFFARGSEWYYKRPILEACWDASIKDDRGRFYNSSPLLSDAENLHNLYIYNIYAGRLRNIPDAGTGEIYINFYSASAGGTPLNPTVVTGGYVSPGIYSCSLDIDLPNQFPAITLPFTLYDRWYTCAGVCPSGAGLVPVHTGSFDVISHEASSYHPASIKYVSTITNLQPAYASDETVRLRLFTRLKNWSPTIYTVATADIETTIVASASYMIYRVIDDLPVLPYGMTRDNCTAMSYDEKGNYFDLDMSFFDPGYAYGIKISFYDEKSWVEQPYSWKFRIEELDEY